MRHSRISVTTFGRSSGDTGPLLFVETGRGSRPDEAFLLICEASVRGKNLFQKAIAEYKRGGRIRTPHEYIAFLEETASVSEKEGGTGGERPASFAASWVRGDSNTWVSAGSFSLLSVSGKGIPRDYEEASGSGTLESGERLIVGSTHVLTRVKERLEGAGDSLAGGTDEAQLTATRAVCEAGSRPEADGARASTAATAQLEMDVVPTPDAAPAAASTISPVLSLETSSSPADFRSLLSSVANEAEGESFLLVVHESSEPRAVPDDLPRTRAERASTGGRAGSRSPRTAALIGRKESPGGGGRTAGTALRWVAPIVGLALVVVFALVIWPAIRGRRETPVEEIPDTPEPVAVRTSGSSAEMPVPREAGGIAQPIALSSRWKKTFQGAVTSSPTVEGGRVYFGCRDGNLYCLDSRTGEQVWTFRAGAGIGSSPAVSDGSVFVGSYDGRLWSVDATSGERNWEFKTAGRIVSSPCVVSGRVLFGSYDRNLYCLSEHDGKLLWKHEATGIVWSSPSVGKDRVFYGSADGSFYCLSLDSGRQYWREVAPNGVYSSPAVGGDVVCFGSIGKAIHFLDASSGKELFKIKAGGEVRASPILTGQTAYVAADDGIVRCVSVKEKKVKWAFEAGRQIRSRPFLSQNVLFVTSYDGRLYALEASTGDLLGSFSSGAEIYSSPTVWEDNVYFGTNNGEFYCLGQERPSS